MMEKILRTLFDYQRFENHKGLAAMIAETENRYGTELTEDELTLVSAAGPFEGPQASPEAPEVYRARKELPDTKKSGLP